MTTVQREAKSRLSVPIESVSDLTTATIAFAFPIRGERPATWVAGAWLEDAVQVGGKWIRTAATPRIGDTGLDLDPGHYRFYGQLILNGDEDVWEVNPEGLEVQ